MKVTITSFFEKRSIAYKLLIFLVTTIVIVYSLPRKGKFRYDFSLGKPWEHENLYAPFDFAILKSEEALQKERDQIKENAIPYFDFDSKTYNEVLARFPQSFETIFEDSIDQPEEQEDLKKFIYSFLEEIYVFGILEQGIDFPNQKIIYFNKSNQITEIPFGNMYTLSKVSEQLKLKVKSNYPDLQDKLTFLFFELIHPNVFLNKDLTQKVLDQELSKVLTTRGSVDSGSRIIAKGEVIDTKTYFILKSLQKKYELQIWSKNSQNWVLFGYTLLVALALLMLLLFIYKFRRKIYHNNTKITFVLFNVLWVVLLTNKVVSFNPDYVYIVPICILPLVIKAFFDARLGFFTHVITLLILGFIVPNSFEYLFLQIITGIVTILSVSDLYKRVNLFISVGQITLVYMIGYVAFHLIQEGSLTLLNTEFNAFLYFILCGFATLISHPLIYGYEKVFGLVSDVSLLELSDTNSKLLRRLSNEAPGTFHHSLNVANIAEAAANTVGANAMLVRVGALYHDIGKIDNPTYFTENQINNINLHDNLYPVESAKIIISHIEKGVELAKKYNLPERIIDFIRTHHGNSLVYFFYAKALEEDPNIDPDLFRYKGFIPFSKETAILMMADSIEAASKSLKNPTRESVDLLVEKIIEKQMADKQYRNANITFKDIYEIKKVMKDKLNNMYHLRVEYPE